MANSYSVKLYPDSSVKTATQEPLGVCFSGGGSRAMTSALGQLSALNTLIDPAGSSGTLMDRVTYISSVSGGTWGAVPFVYVPEQINGQDITDDDLLITPQAPAELYKGRKKDSHAANMAYMNPYCLGTVPGGFTLAKIFDYFLQWIEEASEKDLPLSWLWVDIVGKFILKPFDLYAASYDEDMLAPAKFYSQSEAYVSETILPDNPDLSVKDFYYPREGRPELIANFNLLQDIRQAPQTPMQAMSISTGMPGRSPNSAITGGGTCESFGFGTTLTGGDSAAATVTAERRYSLCDYTACSSAFFAQYIQVLLSDFLDKMEKDFASIDDDRRLVRKYALKRTNLPKVKDKVSRLKTSLREDGYSAIVPQYNYWPLSAVGTGSSGQNYGFSDGGAFENTGLLGLLARTSGNIKAIAFVNCELALSFATNHTLILDDQISRLFGLKPFDGATNTYPSYGGMNPDVPMSYAQIFSDSEGEFDALLDQLANHACGTTNTLGQDIAWARQTLTTVENPVAGISAERSIEVLWIYNSPIARWQDAITDTNILDDLKEGQGEDPSGPLENFPNYSTFSQFCLKPYPVNVLAQFSAWTVSELSSEITDMLT